MLLTKMKKLFLLDAYAIIYRSYYAFIRNPRINSKGINTSAVYGFVNTLEEVLKKEQPTHIGVAFDPKGNTFRHEMYPEYKAQREATPEDIRVAVPIIKRILSAYNIPVLEVPGYEADDVIGTLALLAADRGFETYMLTPDKDYGQLVADNIFMFRPKHTGGYEKMGPAEVKDRYGLRSHKQVIDLLGLMGDSSDNIPGCPGVGEKTAVKLLDEFESIDNLLANTDRLKGALKTKVEENKEQIRFSRFLATIKTDVPIELDEAALTFTNANEEDLRAIFEELEFRTFVVRMWGSSSAKAVLEKNTAKKSKNRSSAGQMSLFDMPPASDESSALAGQKEPMPDLFSVATHANESGLRTLYDVPHNYSIVEDAVRRGILIGKLQAQQSVCFDTETTGLDVFNSELVGLSFCFMAGEAFYVPLPADREACRSVLLEFKAFFQNDNIEKIGQNIKYDLLMLAQYGITLKGKLFDTMIAHYLLQPELRHGMDYLAEIYLKYKTIRYEELFANKPKTQQNIRDVNVELLADYACEDADITFQLKRILEKELNENGLEKLFYEMEMPLMRVLAIMEMNGVRIDIQALRESSDALTQELQRLEAEIQTLAGVTFNVGSPMQVGEVLFDKMGLDTKAKKTKTGQYSTSEEVLEKLRFKHPIVGKILDYRGIKKLLSTYIDALPQIVNPLSGKVHTSFNQTVAATGRLSSTNPNLQNIPVRNEQGREIRKAFIPEENATFLSADYSQIELRIMAHLSGDEQMLDAFRSGQDIHTATAAKIFKVIPEEVTSEMRRKAKTANFGIIYGISAFGLAERLDITRTEAKELIDGYFAAYPRVKQYMEDAIEKARERGYAETIYGRKRHLPDINSANNVVRSYAERNAINAPIQGSAADIIKLAMIQIQQQIETLQLRSKMTMQVHDELNFSVPNNELDTMRMVVKNAMEQAVQLQVPMIADVGIGANWLEAH